VSRIHSSRMGRPGGIPAVLTHCFLGHSGTWPRLLASMEAPLDAIAFDMPGHGRSAEWSGQGDLAAEVAGLIGERAGREALLAGHSFGGAAALRFALENPARTTGVVLIEPVLFAAAKDEPEYAPYLADEAGLHAALAAGDMDRAGQEFMALNGDADAWAALPPPQRAQIARQMRLVAASVAGVHDDSGGLLVPGRLEALDRPVLLLDGAASPPTFGAVSRALARRLPRARRATVPGAGHMGPITHTAAVAAEIDLWIAAELGRQLPERPQTRVG
jgi:lipase